jgi:hypothetical protein
VAMSLPGWTLAVAVAVIFGLTFLGVFTSILPIPGSNAKGPAEQLIPVFEAGDEEPTANRSEDDTPKPVLVPASTETPPLESIEMATDPRESEAVEFVLQKPFAEAAGLPVGPVVPVADPPWFESPPSENTPALSQEVLVQPPEDPYADETLLPVPQPTAPSDLPTGTEETSPQSPQPPPPDLPADAGTPPQPLVPPDETTSSSDLPADSPPLAENTAYLE